MAKCGIIGEVDTCWWNSSCKGKSEWNRKETKKEIQYSASYSD